MSDRAEGQEPVDDLIARGWSQGSVFTAGDRDLFAVQNVLPDAKHPETLKNRKVKPDELLLLITHDCDMALNKVQTVEALICQRLDLTKERDQRQLDRISVDEPRKFVVSRSRGLVAETWHRVLIAVDLLKTLDGPLFRADDTTQLREWLAKRYARDANQDRIHEVVISPLVTRLRRIRAELYDDFVRYTELVKHVRFHVDDGDTNAFRVELLVIPVDLGSGLTEDHLRSFSLVNDSLGGALNESGFAQCDAVTVIPFDELRHVEYLRSIGVPLDWASWDENTLRLGEPPTPIIDQLT
jgi:hypothetical protein